MRNEYLDSIERRIIEGISIRDVIDEARKSGIEISEMDVMRRFESPRVRIEVLKKKLRETENPILRNQLKRQLIYWQKQQKEERMKRAPLSTREELLRRIERMRK